MLKNKKNASNESEQIKDLKSDEKSDNDSAEEKILESNKVENNNDKIKSEEIPDKKLAEELEKKIKEIETLTETMKRRQADFENYKKRMQKIQEEQKKLAIKDFALDIITINDDLLRAFDASCNINKEKSIDEICDTFSKGFAMISKSIEETLRKYGIEEIDSLNQPFNPNHNEAIETDQSGDVKCDTITKVHQKGFRMEDYILRCAKVKVTKPGKMPEDCNNIINNDMSKCSESKIDEIV